jgi:hypothetical protein
MVTHFKYGSVMSQTCPKILISVSRLGKMFCEFCWETKSLRNAESVTLIVRED